MRRKHFIILPIAITVFFAGVIMLYAESDRVSNPSDDSHCLYIIKEGGKYGYIDTLGHVQISPVFSWAEDFSEGLAFVRKDGNKGLFINKAGKPISGNLYSDAGPFSEGLASFEEHGRYGYINKKEKVIISPIYENASPFREGLASVTKGDWFYFIDKRGKIIYKEKNNANGDEVISAGFSESKALIWNGENSVCIDSRGRELFCLPFLVTYAYSEGLVLAVTSTGPASSVIGKEKVQLGTQPTSFAYIDKKGKIWIKRDFTSALPFSEGLAAVEKDGKWSYIDHTGKVVISTDYDDAGSFSSGLARVTRENGSSSRSGYIDKSGKLVIPLQYCSAEDFRCGLAEVLVNGDASNTRQHAYINKKGKVVWTEK